MHAYSNSFLEKRLMIPTIISKAVDLMVTEECCQVDVAAAGNDGDARSRFAVDPFRSFFSRSSILNITGPPLRICYVRSTAHNLLLWFQSLLGRCSAHIVWRPLLRIRKSHMMTTTKEVSLIYQTSRNDIIVTSEWDHFSDPLCWKNIIKIKRTWV